MSRHISFFDLDHTLLLRNSSFSFGFYLYKKKLISLWMLLRLCFYYFKHKMGYIGISELHAKAFDCLFVGKSVLFFKSLANDFLDETFETLKNTTAVIRFNQAKRRGDHIVLLSSSPDFLVEAFAKKFQVDSWKATEYQADNDSWTTLGSVLEGASKALHVHEIARKLEVPIQKTVGYSDCHLDLPFLESVGKAVAVNPTRTLLQIAKKREWEVLHNTSAGRYSSVRRNYT